uniref:Uncharacterized protein n=1 Tax=Trichobilharzia regenti TaxID=157069 RepID=A0AA85K1I6_TRIRE|nr:unnamed protein product [Trichobilharzia regenti]
MTNDDSIYSVLKKKYTVDKIKEALEFLDKNPLIPPKWFIGSAEAKNLGLDLLNDVYKLSRRRRIKEHTKMAVKVIVDKDEIRDVQSKSTMIRTPYIQEEDKSNYWIPIDVLSTISKNEKENCTNSGR